MVTREQDEAAVRVLKAALMNARTGQGMYHGALSVFPIFPIEYTTDPPLQYITLREATAAGTVVVAEMPQAEVPRLQILNRGRQPVFIMDGETVEGGQQNRIFNASMLVHSQGTLEAPVSCVERGRWNTPTRFTPGRDSGNYSLRRSKHQQVTRSLQTSGQAQADQQQVWQHIEQGHSTHGSRSSTHSMHDTYRHRGTSLEELERRCPYPEGAVGMVVAIGGNISGADWFDQPRTAKTLWGTLVRSYGLDSLSVGRSERVGQDRAQRLLERARLAVMECFKSPGEGCDMRMSGPGVVGGALVAHDRAVHVNLYRIHTSIRGNPRRS